MKRYLITLRPSGALPEKVEVFAATVLQARRKAKEEHPGRVILFLSVLPIAMPIRSDRYAYEDIRYAYVQGEMR